MKILLDENLDWRLERFLPGHEVKSVPRIGWAGIQNGKLLASAANEFDVLITMDSSIPFQHELEKYRLAVIGLRAPTNRLADTSLLMESVLALLPRIGPGTITTVTLESVDPPVSDGEC